MSAPWPGSPEAVAAEAAELHRLRMVDMWARDLVTACRYRKTCGWHQIPVREVNALARVLGMEEISTSAETETLK